MARNKNCKRNYEFMDEFEAGIVLYGNEIKSVRNGNIDINNSYVSFHKNNSYIKNMHISAFKNSSQKIDSTRDKKLLLHKHEIRKIKKQIIEKKLVVIPTSIVINDNGYAKVRIVLARSYKKQDKREQEKNKDFQKIKKQYI